MIALHSSGPAPEPSYPPTLAALSRNASVISTSSSDSSPSLAPPRPRQLRSFNSPRSRSPGNPSPRSQKPPAYLAAEMINNEEDSETVNAKVAASRARSRARSRSRNPPPEIRVDARDFTFGEILGEGSYSTASPQIYFHVPFSRE